MSGLRDLDLSTESFRTAVGRFATGITVCSTQSAAADGTVADHVITANSFTSVSLDPLLVLISIERVARFHDEVLASRRFAVSVLPAGAETLSRRYAVRGRPEDPAQLAGVAHHRGPVTGCVLLDDALATIECRTAGDLPGGDHTLVLGEVLALRAAAPGQAPLLYFEGRYRTL